MAADRPGDRRGRPVRPGGWRLPSGRSAVAGDDPVAVRPRPARPATRVGTRPPTRSIRGGFARRSWPVGWLAPGARRSHVAAALTSTEWRVSRLGASPAGARPDLDPSVDVVIVGSAVFDIRDMPRDPVAVAWLADAPERWLDQPWFDEFDVVLAATDEIADLVRRRSAKVATVLPVDATGRGQGGPRGPSRLGISDPLRPADRRARTGASPSAGATTTSLGRSSARSSDRATRRASTSARPGKARSRRATTSPSTSSASRRPRPGRTRSTSCGRSAIPTWPRRPSTTATTTSSSRRTRSPPGWRARRTCR